MHSKAFFKLYSDLCFTKRLGRGRSVCILLVYVVAGVYRSLKQQMTERMHGVLLWMCYFGELHEDLILLDIILLYYDFPLLQHLAI